MMQNKIPIEDIQGMSEVTQHAHQLSRSKESRKKNWRILSIWRELRKNKISYYFLSKDQIAVEPKPFKRLGFIISVERINVPGARFSIDYYKVNSPFSGIDLSLMCTGGAHLLRKLVQFNILSHDEVASEAVTQRYEPYQHCPECGERNKMYAIVCDMCGAKMK